MQARHAVAAALLKLEHLEHGEGRQEELPLRWVETRMIQLQAFQDALHCDYKGALGALGRTALRELLIQRAQRRRGEEDELARREASHSHVRGRGDVCERDEDRLRLSKTLPQRSQHALPLDEFGHVCFLPLKLLVPRRLPLLLPASLHRPLSLKQQRPVPPVLGAHLLASSQLLPVGGVVPRVVLPGGQLGAVREEHEAVHVHVLQGAQMHAQHRQWQGLFQVVRPPGDVAVQRRGQGDEELLARRLRRVEGGAPPPQPLLQLVHQRALLPNPRRGCPQGEVLGRGLALREGGRLLGPHSFQVFVILCNSKAEGAATRRLLQGQISQAARRAEAKPFQS
mmetsp:Transcript_74743/g.188976  ORF Transcript_74743/g.188976 Transcript_74743/m.188976 type:complete len:340 (+) Transcript_74743:292-1311(+)